jgi:hypothetical protein
MQYDGAVMKALCLVFALCFSTIAAAQDPMFTDAVRSYRAGQWSAAYGQFRYLANSGNTEAARIALFMYGHGRLLYGSQWDASEDDLALWSRLAGIRAPQPDQPERVASMAPLQQKTAYKWRAQPFNGRAVQK